MLRAYKYRLYPTDEQKVLFAKTFGCCRYVYNWALDLKIKSYRERKENIEFKQICKLVSHGLKKEKEWLKDVNSQALISSLRNLETAYERFFKEKKQGYPKFKSRKNYQSFQNPQACSVDFKKHTISIPKAKDIPAILHRKFNGCVKTVTVSKTPSGKYFASILIDTTQKNIKTNIPVKEKTIGIDLGIHDLIVTSNASVFENKRYFSKETRRLAILQRRLKRKHKDSKNYERCRIKVAKLYERITNKRKDYLHKITYDLTHDNQVSTICVEDLWITGLKKNHHLAKHINDASWGIFLNMLEYKCKWYGVNFIKINHFEPSSKTCNKCGYIYKGLKLNERSWICPECGTHHDRDYNAACNIKDFGLQKALPIEHGKVKPVDCPLVDDRPRVLKSNDRMKQENRGNIDISKTN